MGSVEDREKHSKRRKRNIYAKSLRDQGDHKGAFRLRVIDPRKTEYKRVRINPNEIIEKENNE